MNSKPFLFDENIFDEEGVMHSKRVDEPKPEFTQDDLEAAKQSAFEEGKKAGISESEHSKTQQLIVLLKSLEAKAASLFAEEENRNRLYENEAVHLSYQIIKKLFPVYSSTFGLNELSTTIQTVLTEQSTPKKIQIEVSSGMKASLEQKITETQHALNKDITLIESPNLADMDCKISWSEGGIICHGTTIAEKIMALMQESLAERGVNVHDEQNTPDTFEQSESLSSTGDIEK